MSDPTSEHVADILEKAADVLATEGHCKGAFYKCDEDGKGPVVGWCAVGAIRRVTGYYNEHGKEGEWGSGALLEAQLVANHLATTVPKGYMHDVAEFNDADETTAEVVIDLMKHAAKDLRNGSELFV